MTQRIITLSDDKKRLIITWKGNKEEWRYWYDWLMEKTAYFDADPAFNYAKKEWSVPYTEQNASFLMRNTWKFVGDAYIAVKGLKAPTPNAIADLSMVTLKHIPKEAYPYQIEAAKFSVKLERSIIALPPGLGKSLITSIALAELMNGKPVLLVCPAFLKIHWQRELMKWSGIDSVVLSGRLANTRIREQPIVYIINYDILYYWQDHLARWFPIIVSDECHKLGNPESKRTKAFKELLAGSKRSIFLSGTPIRNRPLDFWTTLRMTAPKIFNNFNYYKNRFCDAQLGWGGLSYSGASNTEELHALVKPIMYRKTKEEVMPDLPKKNFITYNLDVEVTPEFQKAQAEVAEALANGKPLESCDAVKLLSRSSYALKRDSIIEWVNDFLESGEKIVIGAYHTAVMDDLKEAFGVAAVVVDGRVAPQKRQGIVDKFQTDPKVRVFIGQYEAAGVGFSITAASTLVFAELYYVPALLEQFGDRIHRMTSTGDHVNYVHFLAVDTIEGDMLAMLNEKVKNASKILDGVDGKVYLDGESNSDI